MRGSKDKTQSVWNKFSSEDIINLKSTLPQKVQYISKNPVGSLLLSLFKERIYSYTEIDRPKISWLHDALAGTGEYFLDVGVRTGEIAATIKNLGKRVYGIDIAEAYIDYCKSQGIIEDGAVCNVEDDPIPVPSSFCSDRSDKYDVIFMGEIMEHLLDSGKVLKKMAKICRPGGCVIITTPNLTYLSNRVRLVLGLDLHTLTMDRGNIGHQHIRVFTTRLLNEIS